MIPVRVPADAALHTVGGVRSLPEGHPTFDQHCPVCGYYLGAEPVTLVYVGVWPDDRRDSGWMNGAAVVVHAACAGLTKDSGDA